MSTIFGSTYHWGCRRNIQVHRYVPPLSDAARHQIWSIVAVCSPWCSQFIRAPPYLISSVVLDFYCMWCRRHSLAVVVPVASWRMVVHLILSLRIGIRGCCWTNHGRPTCDLWGFIKLCPWNSGIFITSKTPQDWHWLPVVY